MTLKGNIFRYFVAMLLAAIAAGAPFRLPAEIFKVVIDAGHGGRDIGAPGISTNEKNINLGVAKALARELRGRDEIKVIMTRNNDTFVPLIERARIANKANGDLFVSLHTNSLDRKNPKAKTISGTSVYTLGLSRSDDNLAVAMRENAVMTLEPDYTTTYQGFDPNSAESYIIFEMDQNLHLQQSVNAANAIQKKLVNDAGRVDRGVRQGPFSVLRNTSMPAILIELDFICNSRQEKYMASKEGRNQLAIAIADGIEKYKAQVEKDRAKANPDSKASRKSAKSDKSDKPAKENRADKSDSMPEAAANSADEIVYKIQFATLPRKLSKRDSKGLDDVDYYMQGSTYKYTTGSFSTRDDAEAQLPSVRKIFKDAFIIKMKGSQRLE